MTQASAVTSGGLRRWFADLPLAQARWSRHEIAGALGDLGTFLPLLVAMTVQNGLNFGTALLFAGVFNLVTGLLFSVPIAVQPMKAIAAIAIAQQLTLPQIVAAGAVVSLMILILGLTGWIERINRVIPPEVIRGLQMAIGLSLLTKGFGMVHHTGVWFAADSYLVGIAAAIVALLLASSRRVPAALLLFAAGLVLAIAKSPQCLTSLHLGLTLPRPMAPSWDDFLAGTVKAAIPQLPLTTLNSVIAVCALSSSLFPDRPISQRRMAVSVGMMNLVGVWFGAMPMCHGAGGLAGQYRFGARTNGSVLFLGAVKIVLALLFGSSLLALAMAFPWSILGVMVAISGIELALSARDQITRESWMVVLATVGACIGLNNVALGFAIGWCCYWMVRPGRPARGSSADGTPRQMKDGG